MTLRDLLAVVPEKQMLCIGLSLLDEITGTQESISRCLNEETLDYTVVKIRSLDVEMIEVGVEYVN